MESINIIACALKKSQDVIDREHARCGEELLEIERAQKMIEQALGELNKLKEKTENV